MEEQSHRRPLPPAVPLRLRARARRGTGRAARGGRDRLDTARHQDRDRVKPLSGKTMARIEAGLRRFGSHSHLTVFPSGQPRPIGGPAPQFVTVVADGSNHALVVPVEGRDGKQAQLVSAPMRTQTARAETALVVPYYGAADSARPATVPLGALTTRDRYALVVPSGGTWNETAYAG